MAKFKYNGNCSDNSCFGLTFRVNGENTPAETDDERIIRKLRANSHYDEVSQGGRPKKTA